MQEESHSTVSSVINRESGVLRNKYVGWKLSQLVWKMQPLLMLKGARHLSPDTASSHSPPCPCWRGSPADAHFRPASQGHGPFYPLAC